jgi:hypothetical protein
MHYCALNEETFFKINVQCQWDQTTISLCFMFSRMFLGFFLCLGKNHFPIPASSRIAKIIGEIVNLRCLSYE